LKEVIKFERKKQRYKKFNRYKWLIIFLLVLCVLGLSMIPMSHSSVAKKDVEPCFNGCPAIVNSATVTSVNDSAGVVTPLVYNGANVYLIPDGASYTVAWQAYTDALGLGPWQTGSTSFTAGTCCKINTPCVTVCSTLQATLKT
jgi:hypothetical protein